MRLLHFLVKRRLQYYFSWSGNWKGVLGDLGLLLLFSFSAFTLSILYTKGNTPGFGTGFNKVTFIRGVAISMLIMPLILKVFPVFRLKKPFIATQFPVSSIKVALLDLLVFVFCRSRNLCYLLYITIFCSLAQPMGLYTIFSLYLFLVGGIMLAENIVNGVSWRNPLYMFFTLITSVSLYILPGLLTPGRQLFWCTTALVVIQFVYYFVFYTNNPADISIKNKSEAKRSQKPLKANYQQMIGLYMKMLLRNRPMITTLGIGYLFKCIILASFIFKKNDSLAFIIDRVPFIVCLISPIIIFTYVFNNLWTYFYPVALSGIISGSGFAKQVRMYLQFVLPALLMDMVLTFTMLAFRDLGDLKILLTYLTLTVFTLCIGFISTFTKYFPAPLVLDFNQFRARTSRLYTIVLLLVTIAIGLVYNYVFWLLLSLGLLWIISVLLCVYIYRNMDHFLEQLKLRFFNL